MPNFSPPQIPAGPDAALDATFAALADPTRRAILARLSQGDAPVGELAAPFHMSLPAVSRHIKVLQSAGLVSKAVDAQTRRCHLQPEPLHRAAHWIAQYKAFWDDSFNALETYLNDLQTPSSGDPQ